MIRRSLTALGLATLAALGAAPSAVAAEIPVGSGGIAVPDIAPIVVPVPMGFDAAALPLSSWPLGGGLGYATSQDGAPDVRDLWAAAGDDRELLLSIVKPEQPAPVGVGGREGEEEGAVDDSGALDQPAVEPPPAE